MYISNGRPRNVVKNSAPGVDSLGIHFPCAHSFESTSEAELLPLFRGSIMRIYFAHVFGVTAGRSARTGLIGPSRPAGRPGGPPSPLQSTLRAGRLGPPPSDPPPPTPTDGWDRANTKSVSEIKKRLTALGTSSVPKT